MDFLLRVLRKLRNSQKEMWEVFSGTPFMKSDKNDLKQWVSFRMLDCVKIFVNFKLGRGARISLGG